MKFVDLNNKEHTFELNTKFKVKAEEDCKSKSQHKVGNLLCKLFGRNNVFEDYPLPGCGNLSWDFWVPHRKLAFEFHGRQHFEYVEHFHSTHEGFRRQQSADIRKEKIAELNDVTLIILQEEDFAEWTEEELSNKIIKGLGE